MPAHVQRLQKSVARSVSAVFTARCYAKNGLLSQNVCLSVWPSVTRRYSVETAKHIEHLPSGSHTILVFPYQRVRQYCEEDLPLMGASNARVRKNRDFGAMFRIISETI